MIELTNIRTGAKYNISKEEADKVTSDKYLSRKYRAKVIATAPKVEKPTQKKK